MPFSAPNVRSDYGRNVSRTINNITVALSKSKCSREIYMSHFLLTLKFSIFFFLSEMCMPCFSCLVTRLMAFLLVTAVVCTISDLSPSTLISYSERQSNTKIALNLKPEANLYSKRVRLLTETYYWSILELVCLCDFSFFPG